MTLVDSHLHVWRAAEGETPGVTTIVPPQTDVPIEQAAETLSRHAVGRAVLVQPVFRGEDNSYVASCARHEPSRYAAVCVVDPRLPGAAEQLAHWVAGGCRGLRLRPRIAAEAAIFDSPASDSLWRAAERLNVVVSVLASPEHAAQIDRRARAFPNVPIVVDHMGHPDVTAGTRGEGFCRLLELAERANVFIKLSGFYHFSRDPFPFADCHALVRAAYERFGPRRLMWGSDFPHVVATIGYERALALPEAALDSWPADERRMVMGDNALKLYWPGG